MADTQDMLLIITHCSMSEVLPVCYHPYPSSLHFLCGENEDESIQTTTRRNLRIFIWRKCRKKCREKVDGSIRTVIWREISAWYPHSSCNMENSLHSSHKTENICILNYPYSSHNVENYAELGMRRYSLCFGWNAENWECRDILHAMAGMCIHINVYSIYNTGKFAGSSLRPGYAKQKKQKSGGFSIFCLALNWKNNMQWSCKLTSNHSKHYFIVLYSLYYCVTLICPAISADLQTQIDPNLGG